MPEFRVGGGGEGAHWYLPADPTPRFGNEVQCVYEILGKNGNWRPVHKGDARKHGFVPGVSSITSLVAAPALERWKVRQGILSALTHPKAHEVKDTDELLAMIEQDSKAEAKRAAEAGTAIHKAIEQYFADRTSELEHLPYINAVCWKLQELTGVDDILPSWKTETAATHPLGYGGRVDLFSAELGMVVDIKGKEFGPEWVPEAYPEQAMQLAAYRELVLPSYHDQIPNQARCINLFVSRNNPGLVKAYEWNPSDIERAWKEFECLLEFWRIRNGF